MSFLGFKRENLTADLVSGAVTALIAIPDAIASAFIAGVNPTYGFNALIVGSPIGSLITSSHFMNIGLTSAMMLAVADALVGFEGDTLIAAMFTLTLLIGVFQLLLGLFKLGKFTQFISNSVMVGFLTGVAISVMLGQLGDLTGYYSDAGGSLRRALDTVLSFSQWDMVSLVTGLATIAIIVVLGRTRLGNFSVAIALIVVSVAVYVLGLGSVALVGDATPVSGTIPRPVLPDLALVPQLLLSAIAIGLIGLIQGAGVSQSVPNPDGEYPHPSRDFSAQGVANIASGAFQGLPLGGSLGGTGIILSTGAKSRWANVFLGIFVAIFVIFFASMVDLVAMPAIAGVLMVVGVQIINKNAIGDVWDVSVSKRLVMLVTFLATLTLPVAQAVIIGVFLSFIDYIYSSSKHVQLSQIRLNEAGTLVEDSPPSELEDNSVTVLYARGSYYFAAARTIQDLLPVAKNAKKAVVVLRMRGVDEIGSTFITVLERYGKELRANGGRLMLSGLSEHVKDQLIRTETTETIPEDALHMATETLGASTKEALEAARVWMAVQEAAVGDNPTDDGDVATGEKTT